MNAIRITVPMALGPAQLVSTNVPENEHAAWSAGATYALGDRVIRASAIYESAQAGNIGHDPIDAGDAWWLYVNPTNRWAAFSLLRPTPTRRAEPCFWEFALGRSINAIHIIGALDVEQARVRLTSASAGLVYDTGDTPVGLTMVEASYWNFFYGPRNYVNELHYYNLPPYEDMTMRLDFAGGADMRVTYIMAGAVQKFGVAAEYGLRLGYESWGSTPRDNWGTPNLKKRPKANRMTFQLLHEEHELDELRDFLMSADTEVALWNVAERYRSTKVLGTLTAADTVLSYYTHHTTNIELLGMPNA